MVVNGKIAERTHSKALLFMPIAGMPSMGKIVHALGWDSSVLFYAPVIIFDILLLDLENFYL